MLAYVGCVIGVITLAPFSFAAPSTRHVLWWSPDSLIDPVANVALFLPFGFLYALMRSAADAGTADADERTLRRGAFLGCLASSTIELVQLFEPDRYPSPADVVTNTIGAALGVWLFHRAARRLVVDGTVVGRLGLELPLMGLAYLVIPLAALAALTAHGSAAATPLGVLPDGWGLVALALFGGTLLGEVQRRHFGPNGAVSRLGIAALGGAGFAAGAFPAIATASAAFTVATVAAAMAAWWRGADVDGVTPIERRFESEALGRAAPWFAGYLLLVPTIAPSAALGKVAILRDVESLAAFTVLGYLLAEAWGRLELRYRHTAWRIALIGGAAALTQQALRHGAAFTYDVLPSVAAHLVSAAYGGWIYHLQRAHVWALVAVRRVERAAPVPAASVRRRA